MASIVSSTTFSLMSFLPCQFQLFQPIGGDGARSGNGRAYAVTADASARHNAKRCLILKRTHLGPRASLPHPNDWRAVRPRSQDKSNSPFALHTFVSQLRLRRKQPEVVKLTCPPRPARLIVYNSDENF